MAWFFSILMIVGGLLLAFALEFARGMATAPSMHPVSFGVWVGLAIAASGLLWLTVLIVRALS